MKFTKKVGANGNHKGRQLVAPTSANNISQSNINVNSVVSIINNMQESENNTQNSNNIAIAEQKLQQHNFYSAEIESAIVGLIEENSIQALDKTEALIKLDDIAKENNYKISESPYSFSVYAIQEGGKVDWNSKPDGSYRVSDHWNFF